VRKAFRVAKTEYLNLVRTKAFLVSVFLMPVLMGGAIAAQALLKDKVDTTDRKFAVVDRSGSLFDALRAAAAHRNETAIRDPEKGKQILPRFIPVAADEDTRALSDRVRQGDLFAYVVIGADVVDGGDDDAVAYHSQSPTYQDLPAWIQQVLDGEVRRRRFAAAAIDQALVARLSRPTHVWRYGLVEVSATGEVKKAERVNRGIAFGVPLIAMMLLFLLVMTSAPLLLNNVLEEKMQRISEILVSSVSPFELFLGKLVGVVFVSWTLSLLYLGGAAYLAAHFGFAHAIPIAVYGWFLLFQLLALFIYGSIFSALGAACSELRDAQTMMMPAMLLVMIPMFVYMPVLKEPTSAFSVGISLFPPATPFLMLMRLAVPPGPALWEVALGIVLTVGFTLLCVAAGAKIFRIGILAQGQTPSFRKLVGWIFR